MDLSARVRCRPLRLYAIRHTAIDMSLLQLIDLISLLFVVWCCCCELIQQTHECAPSLELDAYLRYPLSCDILILPYHPSSTIVWSHHYMATSCSHLAGPSCRVPSQLPVVRITSFQVVYSVSYCSPCSHANAGIYTCYNHVPVSIAVDCIFPSEYDSIALPCNM